MVLEHALALCCRDSVVSPLCPASELPSINAPATCCAWYRNCDGVQRYRLVQRDMNLKAAGLGSSEDDLETANRKALDGARAIRRWRPEHCGNGKNTRSARACSAGARRACGAGARKSANCCGAWRRGASARRPPKLSGRCSARCGAARRGRCLDRRLQDRRRSARRRSRPRRAEQPPRLTPALRQQAILRCGCLSSQRASDAIKHQWLGRCAVMALSSHSATFS